MKFFRLTQFIFIHSLVLFFSCKEAREVTVDFNKLLSHQKELSAQFAAENAQEINKEIRENIIAKGLERQLDDSGLQLRLNKPNAEFTFNPVTAGLPGSWKEFTHLKIKLLNQSSHDIKTTIILWAPRGRLPDTVIVKSDAEVEKRIDLHDLPLIGNVHEKYKIGEIALFFENYPLGSSITIRNISLIEPARPRDFVVVDKFGQRMSTEWPGKVKNEDEFHSHLEEEKKAIRNFFENDAYDQYLGFKVGKTYQATGFFTLGSEVINGSETWFFITPEGNPFWSFGVTCIRSKKPRHSMTLIKGNEQLFDELPAKDGPYGSAFIDSTFSFYNMNILKKYGDLQSWREMSYKRLRSWGLNTIGNWAEDSMLVQSKIPFTFSFETGIDHWKKDVFDPKWVWHIDSIFTRAEAFKENPFLLGYFVDNEAGWGNLRLLETLPENTYLRQVWINKLEEKYISIQAYNYKYESQFSSWSDLMNCTYREIVSDEDLQLLEELFTEKYFKTISELLKKYDPNHLYLGCRFTRKLKPAHILKIAGKYCDVVTVNVYSYEPIKEQMDAWHKLTGRPILIGEHQAALKGPRQLPLRWRVFDEDERYAYFINYVEKWAKTPYALGSHWYQYADQHITGRASNGENQIIGFVDITDQPYDKMINAARYNSSRIYQWHQLANE